MDRGHQGFDPILFGNQVLAAMAGRTCRDTAHQIDISPATLNRVTRGKVPDLMTYLKLRDWLATAIRESSQ